MAPTTAKDTYGKITWFRGDERRRHRRHDLESREIAIRRTDSDESVGQLMDLSAGGIRLRTTNTDAAIGQKIPIQIELPTFAGISPFLDRDGPKRHWTGSMTVVRLRETSAGIELGGRLDDLDELDRGMLSLYLSTQPLAA